MAYEKIIGKKREKNRMNFQKFERIMVNQTIFLFSVMTHWHAQH